MSTQSIIVYRSPAEAALWENGLVFPLIIAMVVSVLFAYLLGTITQKARKRSFLYRKASPIIITSTLIVFLFTFKVMIP